MRRTFSTSFLLYMRCPVFDFSGAKFGNSVSQKRRTYGSTPTISQTSEILKKSLSGISGTTIHRHALTLVVAFVRCLIIIGVPGNGNRSRMRFSTNRSNEKWSFFSLFENMTKVGGFTFTCEM